MKTPKYLRGELVVYRLYVDIPSTYKFSVYKVVGYKWHEAKQTYEYRLENISNPELDDMKKVHEDKIEKSK